MIHETAARDQPDSFSSRLRARAHHVQSWLCVGLDPDVQRLPAHLPATAAGITEFCRQIIDATHDLAVAIKINFAFFEALGIDGWRALDEVRRMVPSGVPVIADAKRGDIAHSASAYARAIFDVLQFDAITVSPYIGWDSVEPFTRYPGTCVFVLSKTSNPGASDFQDLLVGDTPLFMRVAREGLEIDAISDLGFVVGATQTSALEAVRALSDELLLLVPGVGAQGADANTALQLGGNHRGDNAIFPVSREILYASSESNFADAARAVTTRLARQFWMGHGASDAGR
jgi:orotidine 5'-phosphate decarboxylase subfamily 2